MWHPLVQHDARRTTRSCQTTAGRSPAFGGGVRGWRKRTEVKGPLIGPLLLQGYLYLCNNIYIYIYKWVLQPLGWKRFSFLGADGSSMIQSTVRVLIRFLARVGRPYPGSSGFMDIHGMTTPLVGLLNDRPLTKHTKITPNRPSPALARKKDGKSAYPGLP